MLHRYFSEFSDRFELFQDAVDEDSDAIRLLRQLNHPGAEPVQGWDTGQLEAACRTIAASPNGSIPRIHLVVPCPPGSAGAIPAVTYAESVAARYGLRVHCTLKDGMITVTVERREGDE